MTISQTKRQFFGILVFILLVISGCSGSTPPAQPLFHTLTPTWQPAIPLTHTATLNLTPSETATPIPTKTATPLPTGTASPTLLPTSTLTFQPTLNATQAFMAIQEFLSQGMDCPTPCFMGIIPGETKFDQALNILVKLGQPIFHRDQTRFYSSSYGYRGLVLVVVLEIEYNIVRNIEMAIGLANYEGDPNPRLWRGFSPDVLITRYGTPSQVGFNLIASPSLAESPREDIVYDLVMYFEPLDLTIEYHGLTKDGSTLKICPLSNQNRSVWVFLGKNPENRPEFIAPLEQVSSLTLQQFSELMTQTAKPACFNISKEAYGPPYQK